MQKLQGTKWREIQSRECNRAVNERHVAVLENPYSFEATKCRLRKKGRMVILTVMYTGQSSRIRIQFKDQGTNPNKANITEAEFIVRLGTPADKSTSRSTNMFTAHD